MRIEIEQSFSTNSSANRIAAGVGLFALVGGCTAVALIDPSKTSIFPACPLLTITGFACPGCGLTRAFHSLFHGDIATMLDFNLLTPIYALGLIYLAVSLAAYLIRGHSLPYRFLTISKLYGFMAITLIFGVLRNIPEYPFTILFP